MKKRYLILSLLIISFISSCTYRPKAFLVEERLFLLDQEISKWEAFKITGIVDIHYQSFSFRNNCIIQKNEDKLRIDVLASGFLSLGGGIIFAAYIEQELMQIRKPGNTVIENVSLSESDLEWISFFTEGLFTFLKSKKNVIIENLQIDLNGYEISFCNNMKLKEINNELEKIRISLNYDRNDNLIEIIAVIPSIRKLIVHVDKIEHDDIKITPLRRME